MSYTDFFQKHVDRIKEGRLKCEECGAPLRGNVSEVAHILPKQYFKSVSQNDLNIIYLCGMWGDCHNRFDTSSNLKFRQMKVFEKASEAFEQLKDNITEKITYKHTDRYGRD